MTSVALKHFPFEDYFHHRQKQALHASIQNYLEGEAPVIKLEETNGKCLLTFSFSQI